MNLIILAILCYASAALLIGLRLLHYPPRFSRLYGSLLGLLGLLAHAGTLYGNMLTLAGINLGFFTAVSLTAWIISALLLLSAINKPVDNLAILIFPFAALGVALAFYYPQEHLLNRQAGWMLIWHVISSMLAYALLTLASTQALLLAIQDNQLHHHRAYGFMQNLPPLQTMETLLFDMIGLGFILLSLSLISGFIFLEDMFAQHVVHKTVLSLCA